MTLATDIATKFITQHEGCKLEAYLDLAGVATIGHGATGKDIFLGVTWTQEQADADLKARVEQTEKAVRLLVKVPVSENAIAALTSFAYNLGVNALARSMLLECLNDKSEIMAAVEFVRWRHAGKVAVKGLLIRRLEEALLFLK